jgi:hypothetical protein
VKPEEKLDPEAISKLCEYNWAHVMSVINKKDHPELMTIQKYLSFCSNICMLILLLFFRKSQREINMYIDVSQTTPSDYSIMITKIPKILGLNYKEKIADCLKEADKDLIIMKILPIYNVSEII